MSSQVPFFDKAERAAKRNRFLAAIILIIIALAWIGYALDGVDKILRIFGSEREKHSTDGISAVSIRVSLKVTPTSGVVPLDVVANASESLDVGAQPLTFDWSIDGIPAQKRSASIRYRFDTPGPHSIEVLVSNGKLEARKAIHVDALSKTTVPVKIIIFHYIDPPGRSPAILPLTRNVGVFHRRRIPDSTGLLFIIKHL